MPNNISISGFNELAAKLKKLPANMERQVTDVVRFAATTWEQGAKTAAPVDQGRLKNEIRSVKKNASTYQVVVNSEQAAWIEWGTKSRARVPAELASYAAQFRGRGSTLQGKGTPMQMIFEWCRRKGLPKEAWYPIYRSIMATGINPHPFFFIQRPRVEKQFIDDLRQVIKTID